MSIPPMDTEEFNSVDDLKHTQLLWASAVQSAAMFLPEEDKFRFRDLFFASERIFNFISSCGKDWENE